MKYLLKLGFHPFKDATYGVRKTRSFQHEKTVTDEVHTPGTKSVPSLSVMRRDLLFILDWDDTLFCSSYYFKNETSSLTPYLRRLCLKEAELIEKMSLIGEVKIISNAKADWVKNSCRRFLPELWTSIVGNGVQIISAQDKFKEQFPDEAGEWKKRAFEELLKNRQSIFDSPVRILAAGDSQMDIDAAVHVNTVFKTISNIHALRFKENPTPEDIIKQIEYLYEYTDGFVALDEDIPNNLKIIDMEETSM
eukprot:TRINITY_DN4965_c0_g1_i1.p1 TRINITY_DN4965_c0_g1~~TRINITY_DN4965_c0_g1_i1.p1  ORF type:complete len:250 (-),score=41.38 TRINITY_DN4965_c0_g1_i1:80-829(-)